MKNNLSVIVPIYNAEKYLARCIESILNQSYKYLEIILVDDGSKDNSLSICKKYEKLDKRIKLIHIENGGLVNARKIGLKLATSNYIAYVDADDWIEPIMYQEMMRIIDKTKVDMVLSGCIRDYGNHLVVDNGKISEGLYEGIELRQSIHENLVSKEIFYCDYIAPFLVTKIYKKTLLEKYQMQVDERITVGEDLACSYPCILNSKRIYIIKKSFYHYCMRADSMFGNEKYNNWEGMEILFKNLELEMRKHIQEVPNILEQLEIIRSYYTLLKHPEKKVYRKEDLLVPFGIIKEYEKVVIYGAGKFGYKLVDLIKENKLCDIVGWIDKKSNDYIKSVDELDYIEYDKIIIAVLKGNIVEEIKKELCDRKIDMKKILSVKIENLFI